VILRSLLKTYTSFEITTYCVTSAAVFFLVFIPSVISDLPGGPPLSANLVIISMGVFPAGLAYLTWGYALSKAEKTAHVTVFVYLTPFIATLIGYFWLGEAIYLLSILGGVAIIAGMVLTNTLGKSKK
jgi:drug/metabolite transporter (DMT)-like permease